MTGFLTATCRDMVLGRSCAGGEEERETGPAGVEAVRLTADRAAGGGDMYLRSLAFRGGDRDWLLLVDPIAGGLFLR